jgi:hypothetical protein
MSFGMLGYMQFPYKEVSMKTWYLIVGTRETKHTNALYIMGNKNGESPLKLTNLMLFVLYGA